MDPYGTWPILEDQRLILAPTTVDDAESLSRAADRPTFDLFLSQPTAIEGEAFAAYIAALRSPTAEPYTMRLRESGEVVGCSSFMDLRLAHRGLEIGTTWIAPAWRGTFVNPAAKLTMMRHAFEGLGCVRVQLKCDARNERSAAAIAKLGAQFEGRLRRHAILPDGYVRDTLMFSVTDAEWPRVRDGLEKRLSGLT